MSDDTPSGRLLTAVRDILEENTRLRKKIIELSTANVMSLARIAELQGQLKRLQNPAAEPTQWREA